MRIPTVAASCVLMALSATGSFAEGDKNQTANPIFGDNCVEVTPPGIDLADCEQVPAPSQSGMDVFFCDGTRVVVCTDEED